MTEREIKSRRDKKRDSMWKGKGQRDILNRKIERQAEKTQIEPGRERYTILYIFLVLYNCLPFTVSVSKLELTLWAGSLVQWVFLDPV
jgi:hypothetical protein